MLRSRRFAKSDADSAHRHLNSAASAEGIPVERAVPHESLRMAVDSNSPASELTVAWRGDPARGGAGAEAGMKVEQVRDGEGRFGRGRGLGRGGNLSSS